MKPHDTFQNLAPSTEQPQAHTLQAQAVSQPQATSPKPSLYGFSLNELKSLLTPSFRSKQVYHWLYHRYESDVFKMDNISKATQEHIAQHFCIAQLEIVRVEQSIDGTQKFLFKSHDGYTFESVLIQMREKTYHEDGGVKESEKWTMCLSSQIGCKVGCAFCFTAKGGFLRNLEASEIVEQVVAMKRYAALAAHKRVNIVFMGMGEPLDNLEHVAKAIGILAELEGLSISPRRQTISTSGIAPKIKKLAELDLGVQLAISLHAVDDELRTKLMPINKAYNIAEVLNEVRAFPVDSRKRVMFEYLLIKGLNDDLKSAKKLLSLLNGIKAKVNLILFNPHEGSGFERPSPESAKAFADFLIQRGLLCTIRESKGIDISAACGQLREKVKRENGQIVPNQRRRHAKHGTQKA